MCALQCTLHKLNLDHTGIIIILFSLCQRHAWITQMARPADVLPRSTNTDIHSYTISIYTYSEQYKQVTECKTEYNTTIQLHIRKITMRYSDVGQNKMVWFGWFVESSWEWWGMFFILSTESWVNASDLHQSCHCSYRIVNSLCLFYEFTNCCRLATNILFVTQLHDGWVNLHRLFLWKWREPRQLNSSTLSTASCI